MKEIQEKIVSNETKNKIFNAAAELFARDGFYKVSVREICGAANVTKPVLYYYFKDKETLLEELIKETYSKVDELVVKYLNNQENLELMLRNLIKLYIEFLTNYPHLTRFSAIIQSTNVPSRILEMKLNRYKSEMGKLISIIKSNQKLGIISKQCNPETLTINFIGTIVMYIGEFLIFNLSIKELNKKLNNFIEFWINTFIIKEIAE
ncbi:MAG: TetR/AcrR family transcriptional regulator [Ignavibacteriae bacterium]|nr:TetR/AcrR family transcriptional regulator [Ignavibacteriota bacterium]